MSTESNVFSQGSGGPLYEFEVQTAYFINFLIGGSIPGFPESTIIEFRQQSGSLNYNTDDLLLKCIDNDSTEHRILFQIKHNLTISDNNELFKEVLKNAWTDFKNTSIFNHITDRIYVVKSNLTLKEKNDLKHLLNWAKSKSTYEDFKNEVLRIEAKKKYFTLFKAILAEIDENVSNDELFNFLKCFDVLEYDFGHDSSTSKAHFLSLIELSKSDAFNSIQVWNATLAFISNSNSKGGFFTKSNLPVDLTKYFNTTYYTSIVKKLKRLSQQNFEIVQFIDNTIGGVNLIRYQSLEDAGEKVNGNKFIILSGEPGVGKSAIAKALLEKIKQNGDGFILAFKADELISKNLVDYFIQFNIELTIKEIFSHFPLYQENVIYIDSAEKLLEGEGVGFKHLLSVVRDMLNIKLIISCRSASLNLVERKFFYNNAYGKVDIPLLNDSELELLEAEFPLIQKLRTNKRILQLIKNPKYLDFAVKAIPASSKDFSEATEVEFVHSLWESIVENRLNQNHDGLPLRRANLFVDLAVKRAKLMLPFITIDKPDEVALSNLIQENIILKSNNFDAYSPAHDVLEDWALVRYVSNQFSKLERDEAFFEQLGTEPAMRRAYRLWVQDSLKENHADKIDFLTRNLTNPALDRFWKDESLIALLNSANCQIILERNIELLKANGWQLFFRTIHIMRTACRENYTLSKDSNFLIPAGYGWQPIIKMLNDSIQDIPEAYYSLIFFTISDWSKILYVKNDITDTVREAGLIALFLLENFYKKKKDYPYEDDDVEKCIVLLFDLCGEIKNEIDAILKKALNRSKVEEDEKNWIEKRYQEKILTLSLSGLKSGNLAKYFPDLLIEIAKERWYIKPPKPRKIEGRFPDFMYDHHSPGDVSHYFGLADRFEDKYFPASAYQTPVLWLLRNHPFKALNFIVELINATTEKYLQSEFSDNDGCEEVELLYNGSKIIQHGSVVLWCMYRGTGKVTPYLLQSVLMSLEYYLLEVCEWGEESKKYLQSLLHLLYTESKSVATTAVISSVCQAYPLLVGDKFVPLFTDRRIISWDVDRYTNDFHPFNLMFNNDAYERERDRSDKLPHRKQNMPGLKGFIVYCCFNIRTYNDDIFKIIDEHRKNTSVDDLEGRKILNDMDVRTWVYTDKEIEQDGKKGILIEPSYDGDLKAYVEEIKEPMEKSNRDTSYKVILIKANKKEESITIDQWREIFEYYQKIENFNFFEHTPGLLAVLGISDFWEILSDDEKSWCVSISIEFVNKLIEESYKPYNHDYNISPFDGDAVMSVIPILLFLPELKKVQKKIEMLTIDILVAPFYLNKSGYTNFSRSFSEIVWKSSVEIGSKLFKGVIAYANFSKMNPFYFDYPHSKAEALKHQRNFNRFRKKVYKGDIEISFTEINFQNYSLWILKKAISLIPNQNPTIEALQFIRRMVEIYIEGENQDRRRDKINAIESIHEIRIALTEKIANIIFWNPNDKGYELFEFLLNKFHEADTLNIVFGRGNQLFTFFQYTIERLITLADNNLPIDDPEKAELSINNFEKIWDKFEEILSTQQTPIFQNLLLLDISWKETSVSWKPIKKMADFFERNIKKYGASYPSAVINLLSHIGDETLMPRGISWIADIFRSSSNNKLIFSSKHSEKLMNRIYELHLAEVKSNKQLLNDYLWMLDEMVTQGSSNSYWIREFVISFR